MSEEAKDVINDMIDSITKTLEDAKTVVTLTRKITELLGDNSFAVRMSVLNMILVKTIIDESDDTSEAMAYVARTCSTLVSVIDKHVEAEMEDEAEETNDDGLKH